MKTSKEHIASKQLIEDVIFWEKHTEIYDSLEKTLAPVLVLLLSDFDDSIIQYNFYAVMNKPYIPCPFGVWEFYELQ